LEVAKNVVYELTVEANCEYKKLHNCKDNFNLRYETSREVQRSVWRERATERDWVWNEEEW